jgi:hypothetical protein
VDRSITTLGGVTLTGLPVRRRDGPLPRDWCAASRGHCFCTWPMLRDVVASAAEALQ